MTPSSSSRRALVVGATGITGQSVGRQLVEQGWHTTGLSRSGAQVVDGMEFVSADLLDADGLRSALAGTAPELVVITAWMRHDTEAENIRVNSAIVRNLLTSLEPEHSLRHVALVTGLKHYLGPFESYGKMEMAETPFRETEERLDVPNFYYAQEDELFAAAAAQDFTWSVHRAHTVFGFATGNAMNMALTLSVYATLCKERGEPFIFPGSGQQWDGLTDITDADLLGEQLIWAGTHPEGANQAFNITNGDVFRWRWLWPRIAEHFGLPWEGYHDEPRPLEPRMSDAAALWTEIASRHGLVERDVSRVASWWHSDADLGRNIECITDMTKSKKAGFLNFRATDESFFDKVARYRAAHIIP